MTEIKCADCNFGCFIAYRYGIDFKTCKRYVEAPRTHLNPRFKEQLKNITFCESCTPELDGMKIDMWFLNVSSRFPKVN